MAGFECLPPNVPSSLPPLPAPNPKPRTSRTREPRAPRIPDDLPLVEHVLEPAEVLAAPQARRRIGEEVSDQLEYEPGHCLRRRCAGSRRSSARGT
jgi:transposase